MTWKVWKPCAFFRKTFAKILRRPSSGPPDQVFRNLAFQLSYWLNCLPNDPNAVVDLITDNQISK